MKWLASLLIIASLLFAGCPLLPDGGGNGEECVDDDCQPDEHCVDGECTAIQCECGYIEDHQCIEYECCNDEDCGEGYECVENECLVKEIKEECQSDGDCPPDRECVNNMCEIIECECGYIQAHECIEYECCSDEDCADGYECESHECVEIETGQQGDYQITAEGLEYLETPDEPMNVYFVDVGDGDAIIIKKGNFEMVVDAGSKETEGKVASYLSTLGVRDVEIVVATHADPMHVGGLSDVVQRFPVEQAWTNGNDDVQEQEFQNFMELVNNNGIPLKHPEAGDSITVNGIEITVLNPQKQRAGTEPDVDAVALKVSSGGVCVILQSDVEMGIEQAEVGSGIPLGCEVLKVGKHGAGSASSFLLIDAIQPEIAVISVGETDRLEPHPTILERFRLRGAEVYRTDLNGTVTIVAEAGSYSVYTSK